MNEILKEYSNNLKSGNLYTIAARPLTGKTTIAKYIANIAASCNKKVLYIYTESEPQNNKIKERYDKYDVLCRRLISAEEIRNIVFIGKYNIVIIDSFQYMHHKRNEDTAYKLKRISEEINAAIIVLSGISRKADARKDHIPIISDMKKKMCGTLWKSSDNVVFLVRKAFYDKYCSNGNMHFIIAKDIDKCCIKSEVRLQE